MRAAYRISGVMKFWKRALLTVYCLYLCCIWCGCRGPRTCRLLSLHICSRKPETRNNYCRQFQSSISCVLLANVTNVTVQMTRVDQDITELGKKAKKKYIRSFSKWKRNKFIWFYHPVRVHNTLLGLLYFVRCTCTHWLNDKSKQMLSGYRILYVFFTSC